MYAATTGTFLQRDPFGQPGEPTLGYSHEEVTRLITSKKNGNTNLYEYVRSSPLTLVDPLGLQDSSYPWGRGGIGNWGPFLRPRQQDYTNQEYTWTNVDYFWQRFIRDSGGSYGQYRQGCQGLAAIRLGLDPRSIPERVPGLRCFTDMQAALFVHNELVSSGGQPLLFALQGTGTPHFSGDVEINAADVTRMAVAAGGCVPADNPSGPAMGGGEWNFATMLNNDPSTGPLWEWMNHGWNIGNKSTARVRHSHSLPQSMGGCLMQTTIYCVSPNKNTRLPPMPSGGYPH